MKHILLRTRKDTFEVISPEDTLVGNSIADNAGNLIFAGAVQRILSTPTSDVTADHFAVEPGWADRVNERYDVFVVPLANAFRPSFETNLVRLTAFIRRLRIPVVVLGVGSQATVDNRTDRLRPIEPAIRGFVDAVLDRSASIGVRGELTHDYLTGLGYRDVEVIGCPSLFLSGDRLHVEKRRPALDPDARLAINVSPYVKATGPIVAHHVARYPNLTYLAQDIATLQLLLWGGGDDIPSSEPRPIHRAHPLFRDDKVRFFVDPWPWIDFLRGMDFSFGTRIHGNIAALLAGTPAVVLAHDSRTLELARYFDIPHRLIRDLPPDVDAADLYAEADFTAFNAGHAERWSRFEAFLHRHGLEHAFEAGETAPSFAERVAATPYPPAVTARDGGARRRRTGRLRRGWYRARRLRRSSLTGRARQALARARSTIG